MYIFKGKNVNGDLSFHFPEKNNTIQLLITIPKFKYYKVTDNDFIIYEKEDNSPFKGVPRHNIGDIIFINNPDKDNYNYDGLKLRKATQFEYDKYEFTNFPNISSNAAIYEILIDLF